MDFFMSNYIIALDIGNTNAHIGLINCSSRTILSLDIFPVQEIQVRCVDSITSLFQSMKHVAPLPVVGCCVIKSVEKSLSEKIKSAIGQEIQWIHFHPNLPFSLHYESPSVLRADRLANMMYGYKVYKDQNLIIISSGTTITIDYMKAGCEFLGGAILPGVSTQLKCLHDYTSELPLIDIGEVGYGFPGTSTKACILNGVRMGIAGALSRFVEKYKSYYNQPALVLCTGGSWKSTQDLVDFQFEFIPELTLVGCALFYGL
jgi:pantothenate kinase type III